MKSKLLLFSITCYVIYILTNLIKHKKHTSLQHRVRATKSHIQNSTNHFSGIMWWNDLIALASFHARDFYALSVVAAILARWRTMTRRRILCIDPAPTQGEGVPRTLIFFIHIPLSCKNSWHATNMREWTLNNAEIVSELFQCFVSCRASVSWNKAEMKCFVSLNFTCTNRFTVIAYCCHSGELTFVRVDFVRLTLWRAPSDVHGPPTATMELFANRSKTIWQSRTV